MLGPDHTTAACSSCGPTGETFHTGARQEQDTVYILVPDFLTVPPTSIVVRDDRYARFQTDCETNATPDMKEDPETLYNYIAALTSISPLLLPPY